MVGPGYPLSDGAVAAAKHALEASNVRPEDLDVLIYAGVCRELFEPATACRVAAERRHQGRTPRSTTSATPVWASSTASSTSPTGSSSARSAPGMVVSCETAREINDDHDRADARSRGRWRPSSESLATLTGGSGAVAVLLTDGSFSREQRRRLLGGVDPDRAAVPRPLPLGPGGAIRCPWRFHQFMSTDSVAVLKHGVELGTRTWTAFLRKLGWIGGPDRQGDLPPGRLGPPRHDPEVAGHRRREGVLDVSRTSATSAPSRSP